MAYVRQLASGDSLDDLVQEVFLAVWRKAGSYQAERGDVAGWLYTITRNKLFDLWRRQGRSPESEGFDLQALAGGSRGVPSELRLSLEQALGRLRADAPGTSHQPTTDLEEGCAILVRLERPNRFYGWRGVLQRLLGHA